MGIVHHPRYLVYFEIARTRWLRDLGLPYAAIIGSGVHLAILEAEARYLRPARYDDVLHVTTRCTEAGRTRLRLEYEVRRGDELLATGATRLGSVNDEGRPRRMPPELREVLERAVEPAPDAPPPAAS